MLEVPTLSELDLREVVEQALVFVLASKKTPLSIVGEINRAVVEIVQTPEVQERFEALGFSPVGSSSSDTAVRLRQEIETWSGAVTKANNRTASRPSGPDERVILGYRALA
jgi:tripartite-type tricarboxylate transporter receptor subunit TctC